MVAAYQEAIKSRITSGKFEVNSLNIVNPGSHIHNVYSRPWQDHSQLKIREKSDHDLVNRGYKIQTFTEIYKNNF